ncbi:low molecular weight phosphatase family protein [Leucobacter albus]|uniref:Low molecular weight phosphatase family protein n=1 Tax=Leucobacter albus TaxID=272210 RepID=A0ABW3TQ66_9MICO
MIANELGQKSQIAAGLMRALVGEAVAVDSAGTEPGQTVNALAAEVLGERGIEGVERMRLVCDDIRARVEVLARQLVV